jgi:large subunit ribosomal protein L33
MTTTLYHPNHIAQRKAPRMTLSCATCHTRNYQVKSTRKPTQRERFQIKKFCPRCQHHTLHVDTP